MIFRMNLGIIPGVNIQAQRKKSCDSVPLRYLGLRYTVEGLTYTKLDNQSLPISTPNVYNKFGIEDG